MTLIECAVVLGIGITAVVGGWTMLDKATYDAEHPECTVPAGTTVTAAEAVEGGFRVEFAGTACTATVPRLEVAVGGTTERETAGREFRPVPQEDRDTALGFALSGAAVSGLVLALVLFVRRFRNLPNGTLKAVGAGLLATAAGCAAIGAQAADETWIPFGIALGLVMGVANMAALIPNLRRMDREIAAAAAAPAAEAAP